MPEFVPADPDFILSVMHDPRVLRWAAFDNADIAAVKPRPGEIYYQISRCGFIMFRGTLPGVYEIHVAMLKAPRDLPVFINAALKVMRSHGARKFIAPIGGWNRPALRLAEKCGFIPEGNITDVFLRDGRSWSMIMWGSS